MNSKEAIELLKIEQDKPRNCGCEMWIAFDEAIEALEKQIPRKPIDITEFMLGKIKGTEGDCECGKHLFFGDKYCPNCGQAIEWS